MGEDNKWIIKYINKIYFRSSVGYSGSTTEKVGVARVWRVVIGGLSVEIMLNQECNNMEKPVKERPGVQEIWSLYPDRLLRVVQGICVLEQTGKRMHVPSISY